MKRFLACAVAGLAILASAWAADDAVSEAAPAEATQDLSIWKPQIEKVHKQFDVLKLFSAATQFGGVSVKLPDQVQQIPLGLFPETKKLEDMGVRVFLKELEFKNADFSYDKEPQWIENHPAVPSMMKFGRVGFTAKVKTGLGELPVECEFQDGQLPFDFDLTDVGYAVNVIPERRNTEAQLDNLRFKLGQGPGGGLVSKIFGKELAKTILKFAAGQTLVMEKGSLLSQENLDRMIDKDSVLADPAVQNLLRGILK
ncbi:MAG TPA: hypothetical protein PLO37_10055 [Candidatus Hydrogenedentes bacterium]|nr:hypothetical protein [Candidatus Hydrogenedentota bacterium]HPG67176.1 hypothetical protein [Candidatus Hydrogenedentota bacterium]